MTLTDFLQPLDLATHIRMAEADADLIYFGPSGDLPLPVMQQYEVIECWSECYPSIGGICGISIIIIAFSLATYGFAKPPIGSAGKGTYLLCWVFSCQGAGERTISAKEKSVGEWSVPPYDLLLFLPHCTSCEATQFLSVLSMLYENWVCGL